MVGTWVYQPWLLVTITIVFSMLMVSPISFFAFKFKNFSWIDNKVRFTFIALVVLLVGVFHVSAIPLVILLYIVSSIVGKSFGLEK
jgi:CDP-diacylglycerol--serine O-phosphatidyltransferase